MSEIVKQQADVHFNVALHPMSNAGVKPGVAIATQSSDNDVHSKIYSNIYDLTNDYQENSNVYSLANGIFEADNYSAPVEVISYPKDVGKIKGSIDSANVTINSGIQAAFYEHLLDGFGYVVLDGPENDAENLSDFLYDNQRAVLIYQAKSVDDLKSLYNHVQSYQKTEGHLSNVYATVYTQDDANQAANIAGYAAGNEPVDFQQIGNQSEFKPDNNLSTSDLDTIEENNGSTVVNKADDYMELSGKSLGGNYIDQFIKFRHSVDYIQYCLQKKHNSESNPTYDQAHINEYVQTALAAGQQLLSNGYIDKQITVKTTPRNQISDSEVESRQYNHYIVNITVANTIDKLNGQFQVTF